MMIPKSEIQRLDALRSYQVLDTPPEQAFDDLTQLAAQLLDVPIALISLVDEDRQWFKSRVGLKPTQTPRNKGFCDISIRTPGIMVVSDAQLDDRFASNPLVVGEPNIRFYAGAPLVTPEGDALGTLCVIDHHPRVLLDAECATLNILAKQVMTQMTLHKQNLALEKSAAQLQSSLSLLNNLADRVPGAIYQYCLHPDGSSSFPFISAGVWDICEVTPEQVRKDAAVMFDRSHPDDVEALLGSISVSANTMLPWLHEFRLVLPQHGVRWCQGNSLPEKQPDGSILWHGYISDITERKQAEAATHRLAYFDALTNLPNRRLLTDRIEHALASEQRAGHVGAVMFIDLDNFKQINDAQGHSVGDELLVQVAERLTRLLRAEDTVARLGGDEFVVLACDLGDTMETGACTAMALADKICETLDQPYIIKNHPYSSTGSLGITLFPKGGEKVDDLLREADTAMYRAKESGRNRVAFYEPAMQADVQDRLALEQDLKKAVAAQELVVYVQTQVDADGTLVGGELLLRWQHAVRGAVSPACFIPVAEESGLILRLGDWVVWQACEALATLHAAGHTLSLSVNVSPRQFRRDDFVERIGAILRNTGAPASGLILEVTEGLLIKNWEDTAARMAELVAMGVRFSIDDFGTGYSSLAYLKKLPLYELKIDRSFVQDTPADPSDTAIVQSILSVAQHLKLRVVAEGVETQAQADFLRASQCDCLQGYLFARPVPMAQWLTGQLQPLPGPALLPTLSG